jgi:hypothetical protein
MSELAKAKHSHADTAKKFNFVTDYQALPT